MEKHWLSWRFLESSFCKAIFWNRSRPKFPSSLFLTCNLGSVFSVGGPKLNSWKDPLTTSKKISSDCWCILTLFSTYCFKREKEPRNERTLFPKYRVAFRGLQGTRSIYPQCFYCPKCVSSVWLRLCQHLSFQEKGAGLRWGYHLLHRQSMMCVLMQALWGQPNHIPTLCSAEPS